MAILAGGFSIRLRTWKTCHRLWLALLVGINLSIATLILQQALIAQQSDRIERSSKLHTLRVSDAIRGQIKTRILALVRMAERWQVRGKTPLTEWQADANNYITDSPGYQAIEWVDPSLQVRWIAPQLGNATAQNLNLKVEDRHNTAIKEALSGRSARVTRSVNLVQGGKGFRVYVPLLPKSKFDGFIVGVFRTQKLLDTIVEGLENQQTTGIGYYSIAIYDGEEEIYTRHNDKWRDRTQQADKWVQEATIKLDGVTWRMRVSPSSEFIAAEQSPLPNAILVGGLLMSWLLAWTVYLLQMAYFHAKAVELSNQELEREISDRQRSEAAFSQLSHKNELILNAVGEGIFGIDQQLRISFVNSAAAKMLGYPVEKLISLSLPAIICQSSNFYRNNTSKDEEVYCLQTKCSIWRTIEEGSVRQVVNQVFWRKDGTSFPVEYVSTPMREGERIVGAVVVFKDISDRLTMEKMKDEFISVVSHELRTPLTSIRGAVGLLAGGLLKASPEKAQRMLEIAIANTDRLGHLIESILDLQRIESGQLTLNKQLCNASHLMVHAVNFVQSMAREARVNISVIPVDAPLWGEPNLLLQTLTNLLSNAIKFSPPDTTVQLSGDCRGESIVFKVQDRGRGIPSDKLESIFERFQQVDASDSRAFGGTGLGLAICRCIVQQHGGRIWAESRLGVGSTFFFTLPVFKEMHAIEKVLTRSALVRD